MRRQARRRSPNRRDNRYSADERPKPRVAGHPAASDRLRVAESGRDRRTRDMGAPRRSPAIVRPPAGARSPIGTRFLAGVRSLAMAPQAAGFRSSGFRSPGFRRRSLRCPCFRFPATVPRPATAQSLAAAVCLAAGLAPDSACQATAPRSSLAPFPRPRATATIRPAPAPAAFRSSGPPLASPVQARASPVPRPQTRPGGLGSSSHAWFASCLSWQLRREHSTGPRVTVTVTPPLTCAYSLIREAENHGLERPACGKLGPTASLSSVPADPVRQGSGQAAAPAVVTIQARTSASSRHLSYRPLRPPCPATISVRSRNGPPLASACSCAIHLAGSR